MCIWVQIKKCHSENVYWKKVMLFCQGNNTKETSSLSRGFDEAFLTVTVLKEASPSAASCCPFLIILEHPSGVGHRRVSCFGSGLPDTCSATTSSYEKLLSWLLQTEVSTQHAVFYFSLKVLFYRLGLSQKFYVSYGAKAKWKSWNSDKYFN